MARLGVNIDHVATLREARGGPAPDPVDAAAACEGAGCDSIVCHLREDRRHIHDSDVMRLKKAVRTRLNLEMSIAADIVRFACRVRPHQATLVPERRKELTTEGGLDVVGSRGRIKKAIDALAENGVAVSLFIDPARAQIDASRALGAGIIELHTGEYANACSKAARARELANLKDAARYALAVGLEVNAGHGLDYGNAPPVAAIDGVNELNIGYSIIVRSVFVGLKKAVEEMMRLVR